MQQKHSHFVSLAGFTALYYGVSICIVTFASALAVFTLNIHHRGFRGVTVPRPLRFICLRILAKVLLIQGDPEEIQQTQEQKDTQLDAFRELRLQLNVSLVLNVIQCNVPSVISLLTPYICLPHCTPLIHITCTVKIAFIETTSSMQFNATTNCSIHTLLSWPLHRHCLKLEVKRKAHSSTV